MSKYPITSGVNFEEAQRIVIYGPEGIGKTSFAANFPEPLYIDTEDGSSKLDVRRLPVPTSWAMLLDEVADVRDSMPCKTLIIDTVDWAERLCREAVCETAHKSGIEEFGYGKGYVYAAEKFGQLLNRLKELKARGIHVVLIAHSAMTKFEQPDELGAYDRWSLKLDKKVAPLVNEWADAVLFINFKTITVKGDGKKTKAVGAGTRVMYTTHHSCWDAKNRYGLPDECPFDYSVIAPFLAPGNAVRTVSAPVIEQPAPVAAPVQAPTQEQPAQEQIKVQPEPDAPDGIPQSLADLMKADDVTMEELSLVVSMRGYYPVNTPFSSYDPDFVKGVLIGAWPQVLEAIKREVRSVPF